MSPMVRFYTCDVEGLFEVIGCADRDILISTGINLGTEFRPPVDVDEGEYYGDEQEDESFEWDYESEEDDAIKDILAKMIMSGLPADLSEDQAFAVQDFFARHALNTDMARLIEPDDVLDSSEQNEPDIVEGFRRLLLEGVDWHDFTRFTDWLSEHDASQDLLTHVQMLYLGRMPESDEPTFNDLGEDAYGPRFGYLLHSEAAQVSDEIAECALEASRELDVLPLLVSELMNYANNQAVDIVSIIEG